MAAWYLDKGPEEGIVISSRIRLARNFGDIPFPARMTKEQGEQVITRCKGGILNNNAVGTDQFVYIDMERLNPVDKQVMLEKHLISPEMMQDAHSRGVFISKDECISIMVNEEDHLRVQCLLAGMQLESAWKMANQIDNILERKIEYAYNENYGYLTSCPTNVGTGLRASVMLHLPALAMTGYLNSLLSAVNKLGIAVRGLYGEGTEAIGQFYQISNQVTLGISEEETLDNLNGVVRQIIEQEKSVGKKLIEKNRVVLEDRLFRSYAIFSNARVMSSEEFMKLLSDVRLGINLGIFKDISIERINELMVATQPANIMQRFGINLGSNQRDIKRAEMIRNAITQ